MMRNKILIVTWVTVGLLLFLAVNYTFFRVSEVKYDVLISLAGLWLMYRNYKNLHQDVLSYTGFLLLLIVHNLYLYPYTFFGLTFDVYMHFFAGIVLAIIVDRWLAKEKWSLTRRISTTILMVMGVAAIHEMVEWAGYALLGTGDGIFFYGAGDEGAWADTMQDLFMNLFGALVVMLKFVKK